MRRSTDASSACAAIRHRILAAGLVLLVLAVLGPLPANALPIASGSKCSPDWVNNEGALACFVQGEEDVRNGVSNPHYVACSAAGDVFCCVDDSKGNQNCEAVKASVSRPPIEAVQLSAILQAQQTILNVLSKLSAKVDNMESKLGARNGK